MGNKIELNRLSGVPPRTRSVALDDRSPVAQGSAMGHAGEILQGAVRDGTSVRRVLVSLPAPQLCSTAVIHPTTGDGLRVTPSWKEKSLRAGRLALAHFGFTGTNCVVNIFSNIPPCVGLGSSTADCVAVIRAIAAWCGTDLDEAAVARIAQQAESSSDSTMFEDGLVAFAHCDGEVHEYLAGPLPDLRILVVQDPARAGGIETSLVRRPVYTSAQLDRVEEMLSRLRSSVRDSDLQGIGEVATASAVLNQQYFPKSHFDRVLQIAEETSALGVAAAHSGTILALLYSSEGEVEQISAVRRKLAERRLAVTLELSSRPQPYVEFAAGLDRST